MINHFISGRRKQRQCNDLDQMSEVIVRAPQEDRTGLCELNIAFQRLPKEQKEALHWIGVEERSYEEVSDATGCAIGTLKSRVHRARLQLRSEIFGDKGGHLIPNTTVTGRTRHPAPLSRLA